MKTTTVNTTKDREILRRLITAAAEAKAAAAAKAAADKALKQAERDALLILIESPRRIRDEDGRTREIRISLDHSFARAGERLERIEFAQRHMLTITERDVPTASLKTMAGAAIARGLLVAVPTVVID